MGKGRGTGGSLPIEVLSSDPPNVGGPLPKGPLICEPGIWPVPIRSKQSYPFDLSGKYAGCRVLLSGIYAIAVSNESQLANVAE